MAGPSDIRGGSDPNRMAILTALSRSRPGGLAQGGGPGGMGGMASPMGAPQGAGPAGGRQERPMAQHLAAAYQAFVAGGADPADQEMILQFYYAIKEIAQPFTEGASPQGPQPAGPPPTAGFGELPMMAAQNARPMRGPVG